MPRVALIVGELGARKAEIVNVLRKKLGLELGKITSLVGSGAPLLVRTLFDRAEPSFAVDLLSVLAELERAGVQYNAYELLDSQEFGQIDAAKLYHLNSERLRNVIGTREESIRQQTILAALQDGEEEN